MSGYIQFVCFVVRVTDSGGYLFCKIAGVGGGGGETWLQAIPQELTQWQIEVK